MDHGQLFRYAQETKVALAPYLRRRNVDMRWPAASRKLADGRVDDIRSQHRFICPLMRAGPVFRLANSTLMWLECV